MAGDANSVVSRDLYVHHKQLPSQQGDDDLNLITLYADCHENQH
jgi:hypothetical protein